MTGPAAPLPARPISPRSAYRMLGGLFILMAFLGGAGGASAHDFHASLTEAQYNPQTRSLEVSLRVFTDDLEKALDNLYPNQEPFRLQEANLYLAGYLKKHFRVATPTGELLPLQYVGQEVATDVTWLYFEFPCGEQIPAQVTNSVFTELYDDQKNLVNLAYQGEKHSYVLTKGETVALLE